MNDLYNVSEVKIIYETNNKDKRRGRVGIKIEFQK